MALDYRICLAMIIFLLKLLLQSCKSKIIDIGRGKWITKLFIDDGQINVNKLRTYRLYKSDLRTEGYIKFPFSGDRSRILAMFRYGSLPLSIEIGRFPTSKILEEQRTCFSCTGQAENEINSYRMSMKI